MADALVDEVPDTDLITEPHYNDAPTKIQSMRTYSLVNGLEFKTC